MRYKMKSLFVSWILLILFTTGEAVTIQVGAIFHFDNYDTEVAFNYAIQRVNEYFSSRHIHLTLEAIVERVGSKDSFRAGKIACSMAEKGVAAIFGPQSVETRAIVESMCQAMEIPNIQNTWEPNPNLNSNDNLDESMSIRLYPNQQNLSAALSALVTDYDWKTYTILYENDDGLVRLQEIFKKHGPKDLPISVYQLDPDDNKSLMKKVYKSGETHIILDCEVTNILKYLREAQSVNLLGNYQTYILTSLDAHTIDMIEFSKSESNITCLRMVDPNSIDLKSTVNDWNNGEESFNRFAQYNETTVKLETALMVDAVRHFGNALFDVMKSEDVSPQPIFCDNPTKSNHGIGLANFLKDKSHNGLTGLTNFNKTGDRNFFQLDIVELHKGVYDKIGSWNTETGIEYTRSKERLKTIFSDKIQQTTYIVSSKLGPPFLQLRESENGEVLEGNDRYEGYSMDLMKEIANEVNFSFKFELTPDGRYGAYNKDTKRWDGVIGQILDRKADFAICDLTITHERKKAVDFTTPFMTLGISILFTKATKEPPDLFSFLQPFSLDVWIFMATAYLGVSILLFILARMAPLEWQNPRPYLEDVKELTNVWDLKTVLWLSLIRGGCGFFPKMAPKEWANPHPCDPEPEELENALTLLNSMWLALGSFLQQGSDILPKATSTRMVAGMWWFFTLIMISSYTANLAAFLTKENMDTPIKGVEDLIKQNKIKYGTLFGGSTYNFFKTSNLTTYSRIWSNMESTRPSVFVDSNEKGIDRVSKSKRKYAFFMESTVIEYYVKKRCDLEQIGRPLDSKGYGIAMPINSHLRHPINEAILKLQESGKLMEIKENWWSNKASNLTCDEVEDSGDSSAAELGIGNVGGVFVVLGFGCVAAFILGVCEFLWNVRQVSVEDKITFKEAFYGEILFAANIWKTEKPIHTKTESMHSSRSGSREREPSQARMMLDAATSFMRLDKIF